jgi:hypothetical protein
LSQKVNTVKTIVIKFQTSGLVFLLKKSLTEGIFNVAVFFWTINFTKRLSADEKI